MRSLADRFRKQGPDEEGEKEISAAIATFEKFKGWLASGSRARAGERDSKGEVEEAVPMSSRSQAMEPQDHRHEEKSHSKSDKPKASKGDKAEKHRKEPRRSKSRPKEKHVKDNEKESHKDPKSHRTVEAEAEGSKRSAPSAPAQPLPKRPEAEQGASLPRPRRPSEKPPLRLSPSASPRHVAKYRRVNRWAWAETPAPRSSEKEDRACRSKKSGSAQSASSMPSPHRSRHVR